jgi:signal transduction histidine kinase
MSASQSQPSTENDGAGETLDDLTSLFSSLAHEIKNPLSVIHLNLDLLAEDLAGMTTPQSRRAGQRLQMVQRQCTRLESLLKDFTRFIRLNRLSLRAGNLNDQVGQVLDLFDAQARQQGVEIARYFDNELPSMMLSPQMLQAALTNLVKNALEAMPEGGQLVARTRQTLRGVALDLIDTGCGMTDETLLKMFNAFYTNKPGGTGLGLPMAKKIIEAHAGVINVQSSIGRGTQITIEFPIPKRIE